MLGRLGQVAKNSIALDQSKVLIRIWRDKNVQTFIVDLNRVDQLLKKGVDSLGDTFGLYASDQGTVSFKGVTKNKKRNTNISLLDTGDFYRSFDVKLSGDGFTITANDVKGDNVLTDIYGKEILGLTNESNNELAKKILPIIIRETRRLLLT